MQKIKSVHLIIGIAVAILTSYTVLYAKDRENLGERKDLFLIQKIEIVGNKKVEKEAILEKIGSKVDMMLDNYLLKKDIQKIYQMQYFDSVEAHDETIDNLHTLVFKVKERPIITKISFDGNDGLSDDDLKGVAKTKIYSIFDPSKINSDINLLKKHYEEKGYLLADVSYTKNIISEENIEIIYHIKEYEKVKVKKITFLGNRAFKDDELKSILRTQEDSLLAFMSSTGSFKDANFQMDMEILRYFYQTKGYLQINVGTPEITISEDRKWVFITLKVNEGPQFSVNKISFKGELLFTEDKLRENLQLKEEETYSMETLNRDIVKLTELYQDEGYAFANVGRELKIVPGENKVDIEYNFEKGKLAYFGRFTIKGNTKSRDKVVRRELLIHEGEKYNGTQLRKSKENVQRLGFFNPESIVFNSTSPKEHDDIVDVEITVAEKNTGQISAGAGFSTATGFFFRASVSEANFRGMGQNLSFSVDLAKSSSTYSINFTEPYLMDTQWTLGGGIFKSQDSTSASYSEQKYGFNVHVGHPIWEYTNFYTTYRLENTKITVVDDPTINTDIENGLASSIQGNLVFDKRDDRSDPRKGVYSSYSIEYAGLGGSKKWLKNEITLQGFYPIWQDLIFRSRLYTGRLDEVSAHPIPRTEKFTLGGARNLRGYTFEAIGPKKTVPKATDGTLVTFNQGGIYSVFTNLELQHPLSREAGLKWVLFFDTGHAGKLDNIRLYSDYGFGFRWFSPIGTLRFEFGWPLTGEFKTQGSQFNFDIGQLF